MHRLVITVQTLYLVPLHLLVEAAVDTIHLRALVTEVLEAAQVLLALLVLETRHQHPHPKVTMVELEQLASHTQVVAAAVHHK